MESSEKKRQNHVPAEGLQQGSVPEPDAENVGGIGTKGNGRVKCNGTGDNSELWEEVDNDADIEVIEVKVKPGVRDLERRVEELEKAKSRWEENFWEESEKRKELEKKLKEGEEKQKKMEREMAQLKRDLRKMTKEKSNWDRDKEKGVTDLTKGILMDNSSVRCTSCATQKGGLPPTVRSVSTSSSGSQLPAEPNVSRSTIDEVTISGNTIQFSSSTQIKEEDFPETKVRTEPSISSVSACSSSPTFQENVPHSIPPLPGVSAPITPSPLPEPSQDSSNIPSPAPPPSDPTQLAFGADSLPTYPGAPPPQSTSNPESSTHYSPNSKRLKRNISSVSPTAHKHGCYKQAPFKYNCKCGATFNAENGFNIHKCKLTEERRSPCNNAGLQMETTSGNALASHSFQKSLPSFPGPSSPSTKASYSDLGSTTGCTEAMPNSDDTRNENDIISPGSPPDPQPMEHDDVDSSSSNHGNRMEIEQDGELPDPTNWMAEVSPLGTRYFPQVGDNLVYFREGHQAHEEQVEKEGNYTIMPCNYIRDIPYLKMPQLKAEELVHLADVTFQMMPPRLVILKLELRGYQTGQCITVVLHDLQNPVDFLVLRHKFYKYNQQIWSPGDRFRHLLVNKTWRFGTVNGLEVNNQFPNSKWKCYNVTWDNGDLEKMSPWEMDVIPDSFENLRIHGQSICATDDELRIMAAYRPCCWDWPPRGLGNMKIQCARILRILDLVIRMKIAKPFRAPVNVLEYPDYRSKIEYPIDLSTIRTRLVNGFYRRVDAIRLDLWYMADNAKRYHLPDSIIAENAYRIRMACVTVIFNTKAKPGLVRDLVKEGTKYKDYHTRVAVYDN